MADKINDSRTSEESEEHPAHVPDPDLMIGGEDPTIPKTLREALFAFDNQVREEKSHTDSTDALQHLTQMRDSTFARVLTMLTEGGEEMDSIVSFVGRASQSLRVFRKSMYPRKDPKIEVFRKTH